MFVYFVHSTRLNDVSCRDIQSWRSRPPTSMNQGDGKGVQLNDGGIDVRYRGVVKARRGQCLMSELRSIIHQKRPSSSEVRGSVLWRSARQISIRVEIIVV